MRHVWSRTTRVSEAHRFSPLKAFVQGGATLLVVLATMPGTYSALAAADDAAGSAHDQAEDLPVCYARGVDAIGRAATAPANPDLDSTTALVDANVKEGLEHFRRCFAPNFSFTLSNRGVAGRVVPDPATRTAKTDAALQWANYVNNAFRGGGYIYTQHHMGSIQREIRGNEGTIRSYLIATHVSGPTSRRTGVSVTYGTYTDKIARINGRWLITQRTLDTIASVGIPAGM